MTGVQTCALPIYDVVEPGQMGAGIMNFDIEGDELYSLLESSSNDEGMIVMIILRMIKGQMWEMEENRKKKLGSSLCLSQWLRLDIFLLRKICCLLHLSNSRKL